MKRTLLASATLALCAWSCASIAQASLHIDTVVIGDAGAPGRKMTYGQGGGKEFGAVNYEYRIGATEVTTEQYAAFLNSVAKTDTHNLYRSPNMGITRTGTSGNYVYVATAPNKPVVDVAFWDAARFVNWLTTGDTERGVYMLSEQGIAANTIVRDEAAWLAGGVAITSMDEWYKAAYYNLETQTYTTYGTGGSIDTSLANYGNSVGGVTDVKSYIAEQNGAYDLMGNVTEWNDSIPFGWADHRGQMGGTYNTVAEGMIGYDFLGVNDPNGINSMGGFRISSLHVIPEPSTYAAMIGSVLLGLGLLRDLRRKA